jgi:hypothetical protein
MGLMRGRWKSMVRPWLVALCLWAGLIVFASVVTPHYPIARWLFWRFAAIWLLAGGWLLGCLSLGHGVMRLLQPRLPPSREHLSISLATGVFAFFLAMFVAGLLHLYVSAIFFILPLLMFVSGAWPLFRYLRRLVRHVRYRRAKHPATTPWWSWPVVGGGLLAIAMLYLVILTPNNVAYDSRWYHLPLAEHYIAAGGIVRFPEGWYQGAYPHLASLLYTWAFLMPGGTLFDRVELAAHLEFVLFLATLAAIPALVRRLVPRARARHAWVAMFLFPGIFVYDSTLCLGADHVAAFWAVPIYLVLTRCWATLDLRRCLLLAALLSAALDTKYTAACLVAFPALAIAARAVMLGATRIRRPRDRSPSFWRGPLAALLATTMLTAPHWLKNLVWYGDPVYPVLHRYLHLHPWVPTAQAAFVFDNPGSWHPARDWAGVVQTLKALVTWSFYPNEWGGMHGVVPVIGSLFTLTIVCLPFLKNTRRLWGVYAAVHVGLFVWYSLHHQDRYLQAMMPWMAAGVAAVLLLIARTGAVALVSAAALVAFQLIWGGDTWFFPTHQMVKDSIVKYSIAMIGAGYKRDSESRLQPFSPWYEIGNAVRRTDGVLIHETQEHLGLRARAVIDWPSSQGGLGYAALRSPRELYDLLSSMGANRVVWTKSGGHDSIAADLIFYDFVERRAIDVQYVKGWRVGSLPERLVVPDAAFGDVVAVMLCNDKYKPGMYHLRDLGVFPADGRPVAEWPTPFEREVCSRWREQVLRAEFVLWDLSCHPALPAASMVDFTYLGTRGPRIEMYVNKAVP